MTQYLCLQICSSTQKCIFVYFLEAEIPCFVNENSFKIFLNLCIYFVQKLAQLILEKLPRLRNGWS